MSDLYSVELLQSYSASSQAALDTVLFATVAQAKSLRSLTKMYREYPRGLIAQILENVRLSGHVK